jgi:hypothetical protein
MTIGNIDIMVKMSNVYDVIVVVIQALTMVGICCTPCFTAVINVITIAILDRMKFLGVDKDEVIKEAHLHIV